MDSGASFSKPIIGVGSTQAESKPKPEKLEFTEMNSPTKNIGERESDSTSDHGGKSHNERKTFNSDDSMTDPAVPSTHYGAEAVEHEDVGDVNEAADQLPELSMGAEPKKKKKNKKRVGKTRRAITGFEENFADAPMTPEEAREEKKLYDPSVSFAERIEECIQRYRYKRRFDEARRFLFDKYLFLGGVDCSQRQFTGTDFSTLDTNISTEEKRQMASQDVIRSGNAGSKFYDPAHPNDWVVDFRGIVSGFLSRYVPECCPRDDVDSTADVDQAAKLVNNFLNYVRMHDVCPEYDDQILAAQAICRIAAFEHSQVQKLHHSMPGHFNNAARSLFCDYGADPTGVPTKAANSNDELDPDTQLTIFRLSILDTYKDDEVLRKHISETDSTDIKVTETKTQTYRVVSIDRPPKKYKKILADALEQQGLTGKVKPTGSFTARVSMIEHAYSNLSSAENIDSLKQPVEKFILDDDLLEKLREGMKMQIEVCKLNIGISFIKQCLDVRVSFDTLLPQSLMVDWKEPVDNERPAPSVNDPNAESSNPMAGFPLGD